MDNDIKRAVRDRYSRAAKRTSCCDTTDRGYGADDVSGLPDGLCDRSLGCGNPVALAGLKAGETVLDLGSGAGLDVLLAARQVGSEGRVYGLDMTDEMLDLARRHRDQAGADNVELIKGEMENIPLPDHSIDVIISNCVVNLSPDKRRVFGECHRLLKPGGRIAIFDLVWDHEPPPEVRSDTDLWCACVGGALTGDRVRELLAEQGFVDIELSVAGDWKHDSDVAGARVQSVLIRAEKPV